MDQAPPKQADASEPRAVTQGRTALSKPLAHFAGYEFVVQCPMPACRYRRVTVAPILARYPGLSVADAIDKLRCQPCRAPVKVNDTLTFERLVLAAFAVMARIRTIYADKEYGAERHRDLCRRFGAEPQIHRRGQPRGSGLGKQRWPLERSLAWVLENRRLCLRYDRLGHVVDSLLRAACVFLVARRLARKF
jgi:transposase